MANTPIFVFRCDASQQVGLGHITRCIALAKTIRHKGHDVHFVINPDDLARQPLIDAQFPFSEFNRQKDDYLTWFSLFTQQHSIKAFVGDIRDGMSSAVIRLLKANGALTVAIDEPSDYRKECDLLFYPPTPAVQRLDWTNSKATIFQGWDYVLLRDEFYQQQGAVEQSEKQWLVMLGGTDVQQQSLPVLEKLISLERNRTINVVVRPDHPDITKINELSHAHPNVNQHSHIKDMADFLASISFAVINFGVTAYELAVMNIASYHFCLDDDHIVSHQLFKEMGIAKRVTIDTLDSIRPFKAPQVKMTKATNNIANEILSKLT